MPQMTFEPRAEDNNFLDCLEAENAGGKDSVLNVPGPGPTNANSSARCGLAAIDRTRDHAPPNNIFSLEATNATCSSVSDSALGRLTP
jgi:hypothetical protein